MSFEEEFDKIIRQKAEDAKYPFDEGSWHKVSGMLDGERKVATGAGLKKAIVPIVALLAVGAIGFFAYTVVGTGEESASAKTELAIQTVGQAKETPAKEISEAPKTERQASSTELTEAVSENTTVTSEMPVNELSVSPIDKPAEEQTKTKTLFAVAKQNKPTQKTDETFAKQEETQYQEPAEEGKQPTKEIVLNDIKQEPVVENNSVPVEQPETKQENSELQSNDLPALQAVASYEKVIADELFPISALMPLNQSEYELKESYQYPVIKDDDYYNQGKLAKTHYLNVEAGGVYLFGWDQQKGKDGKGFDYFGGLNYGRYITRKLSVSVGLQLYNVSNISKPFYEVSNKEYGFGSTSMYTVVTTNNMLFVGVPIKLNYAFNNRNTIAFGVNAGYLAGANSYVDTYYIRDNEKVYSGTTVNKKEIYEGTKSLNLILTAGYTMNLTNRIAVKGEYLYGLTDMFKNTATITSSEKTSGIRVGIQYTLFDK
ncbi:MAG: hypothetical protein JNL60_11030 [Bacteroidia bacterium]|nr:hypothetical protein [Bacteroidia bacterium]